MKNCSILKLRRSPQNQNHSIFLPLLIPQARITGGHLHPQTTTIIHGIPPTANPVGIIQHKTTNNPQHKISIKKLAHLDHTWVTAKSISYKVIQQNDVLHFD
jgi:hypothetical protein